MTSVEESIFRYPVRQVARALRYHSLDQLIGRGFEAESNESADNQVFALLQEFLLPPTDRPLMKLGSGTHGRYGFFDLELPAKPEKLFNAGHQLGLPLLRTLGFLNRDENGPALCPDDFEEIAKDIQTGRCWLRVILKEETFKSALQHLPLSGTKPIKAEYIPIFPMRFRITDACLANSAYVWRWKHFYW